MIYTYIAKDDLGTLKEGTLAECFMSITSWATSLEAESVYLEDELVKIIEYFSDYSEYKEIYSCCGFTVESVD